jgi:hypothetical protein
MEVVCRRVRLGLWLQSWQRFLVLTLTQTERRTQTIVDNTQLTFSERTNCESDSVELVSILVLFPHSLHIFLRMRREASPIDRWGLGRRYTKESSLLLSLLFGRLTRLTRLTGLTRLTRLTLVESGKIRRKLVQQGPSYDDSRRLYTYNLLHFQFHQSSLECSSS